MIYSFPEFEEYGKITIPDSFKIYIVRRNKNVLYVGCTCKGIWNRFFKTSSSHCPKNNIGIHYGSSGVGCELEVAYRNNLIQYYSIEVLTPLMCYNRYGKEMRFNFCDYEAEDYEAFIINKLRPKYNMTNKSFV